MNAVSESLRRTGTMRGRRDMIRRMAHSLRTWLVGVVLFGFTAVAPAETVRVGAAVSLKETFAEIATAYKADSGDTVEFVYGSSGQVATQIKSGADLDVFVSAAEKQMDDLAQGGQLDVATRRVVCGNTLVLIVPAGSAFKPGSPDELKIDAFERIAVGEPKTVPAGQYAAEALKTLKLDEAMKDKLVFGTNVRQVLAYVERGEVKAGVVYGTDAKAAGAKVTLAFTFDEKTHAPIVYPAAVVSPSKHAAAAKKFLDYLAGDKAKAVLTAHGFTLPQPAAKP